MRHPPWRLTPVLTRTTVTRHSWRLSGVARVRSRRQRGPMIKNVHARNAARGDSSSFFKQCRLATLSMRLVTLSAILISGLAAPASAAYLAENTPTNRSFTTADGPYASVTCRTQIQHGNYLTVPYSKIRWNGTSPGPCKRHWAENVYSSNGQYYNAPIVWGNSSSSWAQSQGPSYTALLGSNFYLTPNAAVDNYTELVGQFTP